MEEYIEILTKEGKETGKSASKSEIHKRGFYHNTAHVWFYTVDGKILLQQRAATKLICPLLWDVSVAGHVDAGETIEQAALREIQEEIGLTILEKDLKIIDVFECFQTYTFGIVDNEFHHTFISELKVDVAELKPQQDEVEALKLITIEDFKNKLKHIGEDNHFVASNKSYYEFVLNSIIKKL